MRERDDEVNEARDWKSEVSDCELECEAKDVWPNELSLESESDTMLGYRGASCLEVDAWSDGRDQYMDWKPNGSREQTMKVWC